VTTRGHVHWVVTEYGKVDLFGKNLKQRAQSLVNIAHPEHREWLDRAFYQRYTNKSSKHETDTRGNGLLSGVGEGVGIRNKAG